MQEQIRLLKDACCSNLVGKITDPKTLKAYREANNIFDLTYIEASAGITLPIDFSLRTPAPGSNSNFDYENSVSLHKNLKGLDLNMAADKRLWVGLAHDRFFEYSCKRWVKDKKNYSDQSIKERFHFEGKTKQTRLRNAISRLWWGAQLTFDPANEGDDRYRLTAQYWKLQDAVQGLMERNFGLYPHLRREFLELLALNPQLTGAQIRIWLKAINAAGTVTLLPMLDSQEVAQMIKKLGSSTGIVWRT